MNGRYDSDNDLQDLHDIAEHDREISLSTTTILGIFFLLALLCAVFFGFGYSMGRRSVQTAASIPAAAPPASYEPTEPTTPKPASGSPAASETTSTSPATTNYAPPSENSVKVPATPHTPPTPKPVPAPKPSAASAVAPTAPPAPAAVPATQATGSFIVQVAAVSHQEDANVLMNALKKHGYTVAVRQTPQDKFLHVQIGPFSTKKDADAMKQRLLEDGYKAIVK